MRVREILKLCKLPVNFYPLVLDFQFVFDCLEEREHTGLKVFLDNEEI